MQELRAHARLERPRTLLDHAQAEMDMTEQATLVRLPEGGPGRELSGTTDVVQERGGKEKIGSKPRMELRRLTTDGRDSYGVLEQAPGIRVMRLRCRQPPERGADRLVREEPLHRRVEAGVSDLTGKELEEAVQLVGVAPERRSELGWIGLGRGFQCAHIDLEAVAELLYPSEHPHGISLCEPRVEELDIVPDTCVDPAARIDELEREVRSSALCPHPLLAGDCVDALDDPFFGQLRDRAHEASLGPGTDARVGPDGRGQAVSRRALRRSEGRSTGAARRSALRRYIAGGARRVPVA